MTPVRISKQLERLFAEHEEQGLTLGTLREELGSNGFGMLIAVVSLPMLVPMPPGVSGPVGLMIVFLAVQALLGRPKPWLPAYAAAIRLPGKTVRLMRARALPLLRKLEGKKQVALILKRNDPLVLFGFAVASISGIILLLPIPFMNTLPAIATLAIGMGIGSGNTLWLILGSLLGTGIVAALVTLGILGFSLLPSLFDLNWTQWLG